MYKLIERINKITPGTRWLLVIFWMAIIFAFSHQANSGRVTEEYFGVMNVPVRKMGHLGEYMILYVLTKFALDGTKNGINKYSSIIALTLSILYAASDEWHQNFVTGRSASIRDVAIDSIGALMGVAFYYLCHKVSLKLKPSKEGQES